MSNYLERKVLSDNEQILLEVKKNPLSLIGKWLGFVVWVVVICLASGWLTQFLGDLAPAIMVVVIFPLISAIKESIKFANIEYVVTNKRVMEKYGWLNTHTDEMPLNKVENITVTVSFWGRIFNYGNVYIQGANSNNVNFSFVKDAEEVKKYINSLI